jgi:hypothetical protein
MKVRQRGNPRLLNISKKLLLRQPKQSLNDQTTHDTADVFTRILQHQRQQT